MWDVRLLTPVWNTEIEHQKGEHVMDEVFQGGFRWWMATYLCVGRNIWCMLSGNTLYHWRSRLLSNCNQWPRAEIPRPVSLQVWCGPHSQGSPSVEYRIHSNRRSCPNRRSPPSSSSYWHTIIGEIHDFCTNNAWICGQNFEPIIMHQYYVLLTLSALLLEWIWYLLVKPQSLWGIVVNPLKGSGRFQSFTDWIFSTLNMYVMAENLQFKSFDLQVLLSGYFPHWECLLWQKTSNLSV